MFVLWLYPLFFLSGMSRNNMSSNGQNNVSMRGNITLPALSDKTINQKQSLLKRNMSVKMSTTIMESVNEEVSVISPTPFNPSGKMSTTIMESLNEVVTVISPTKSVKWGLDREEHECENDDNTFNKVNGQEQLMSGKQSSMSLHLGDSTGNVSENLTGELIGSVKTSSLTGSHDNDLTGCSVKKLTEQPVNSSVVTITSIPPDAETDLLISPDILLTSSAAWQSEKMINWWQEEEEKKKDEGKDKQQPQPQQPSPKEQPPPQEQPTSQQPPPQDQPPPQEQTPPHDQPPPHPKQQEPITQTQPTLDVKPKPRTKMKKAEFDKFSNNLIIHMIEWSRANPEAIGYPLPGMAYHLI